MSEKMITATEIMERRRKSYETEKSAWEMLTRPMIEPLIRAVIRIVATHGDLSK